jgi:hypothetical protein
MRFLIKAWAGGMGVVTALLLAAAGVVAQPASTAGQKVEASSFAGKYEGTVKDETGEAKMTLDIIEAAGKFSGTFTTPRGAFKILKGQLVDGSLTLEIERPGGGSGPITVRQNGGNITAAFSDGGKNLTVELHKVIADDISGEWDAVADAQGQPFPFALVLKLDGDKVTGSSSSQLGTSNISSGSWKDGKLAVVLNGDNGQIALVATMIDGKLSGDYDYAGQLQGKWVAVRKK